MPKKLRVAWLLLVSYFFYACWDYRYLYFLFGVTAFSYVMGILIGKAAGNEDAESKRTKSKALLALGILGCFSLLFVLKYLNLFTGIKLSLLVPIGISFYMFQAVGYMIDVYRGKAVQKNFILYALFVGFFPQLTSGPIEHADVMISQYRELEGKNLWDYERIKDGALLFLWGYFQKAIVADRIGLFVDEIYGNYSAHGMIDIVLAIVLYSFQLYCDFDGYTNMARGSAQILGIALRSNFRQPYMAVNIKDLWRRWHITLTSWFTEYLYIPLGGNRKGHVRTYFNIIIVFVLSGLWHGADWTFVTWGLAHGVMLAIYNIYINIMKNHARLDAKNDSQKDTFSSRLIKRAFTFGFFTLALIFFRAESFVQIGGLMGQCTRELGDFSSIPQVVGDGDWRLMLLGILIMIAVDIIHERGIRIRSWIQAQQAWFRYVLYIGVICAVIFCGVQTYYAGARSFIYYKF